MSKIELIDTHCHIHDSEFTAKFNKTRAELVVEANESGVVKLVCVGTDVKSSKEAVGVAAKNQCCYASIAIHPHEAKDIDDAGIASATDELRAIAIAASKTKSIVAIGECGLDYFYHETDATKDKQKKLLIAQLDLAAELDLPLIFHVRDKNQPEGTMQPVFEDFYNIIDNYPGIRGVLHSFSATPVEMARAIRRKLHVSLNGIMTFTKDQNQLVMAKQVPLSSLLLETDAPFLTPAPFRGNICEPKHVMQTAQFLSELRGESLEEIAAATTHNAEQLFKLK